MKRILLLETGSFNVIGGAAKDTCRLGQRLSRDGYRVDMIGDFSRVDSKARTIDAATALGREYDIVWMNSIRDVPLAEAYSKAHPSARSIFVDRGNIIRNFRSEGLMALHPKSIARRLLARSLRGWLDTYVAISPEQLPAAREFFRGRVRIECITIAPHKEYRAMNVGKRFSGGIAVSRLDERQKRISFMLRGVARMKALHPGIGSAEVLRIVGTGIDEERYKSLARSLGIYGNVSFRGFRSGRALIREYNDAGFFVSTSAWESFGRALIEAMACGLPALIHEGINTMVSEEPRRYLVRDGYSGVIYDDGNLDDFAEKFYALCTRTATRRRMASNALVSAKAFSFDSVVGRYEDLIESM